MNKKRRQELLNIQEVNIPNYNFVNDDSDNPFLLGEGGSGIVFKVEQEFVPNARTTRAIKFFVFQDDLIDRFDTYVSTLNFDDEIVNISIFNHQNILKIIDGGYYRRDEIDIPYIVSDYVPGETLEKLLSKDELRTKFFDNKETSIFELFGQIMEGLIYLHNRNFYHCDIAPKNIFVSLNEEGFHVVIGDLGVGKTLSEPTGKEFLVTGSRDYMPEKVIKEKDKVVDFHKFQSFQPEWDIFAVIKTFQESIEKVFEINISDRTDLAWLNALMSVLEKPYMSMDQLAEKIEQTRPIHRIIAGLPELSESDSGVSKKLIPLNDVLITKRIKKITRHPSLTRLRDVPQLLMGSSIFPGSNHTRYEHALGTYENMRRVLIGLLKKEKFIELFSKEILELALVSSLLANVTRFPFSYAIHELRNSDKSLFSSICQKNVLDKLLDYKDEGNGFRYSLLDTINRYFDVEDIETVKNIICGAPKGFDRPEVQIIYSLLNSSIDVRVLDFLQRDPHHLGMSNGFQIDFDELVSFMDLHNNKIAIQSHGVSAVEQVISARYWLYKRVYWNQPNRAHTVMLKQIIFNLSSSSGFEEELLESCFFSTSNELLGLFRRRAKNSPETIDLIDLITSKRPRIFKRAFLINKSEEDSVLSGICEKVSNMKFADLNELRIELEDEVSKIIDFSGEKVYLLIDIPKDENKKLGKDINVIKNNGRVAKLTDLSGIVSGINNYFDSHLQWLRIYIHPEFKAALKVNGNREKIEKVIKDFLIKKLG